MESLKAFKSVGRSIELGEMPSKLKAGEAGACSRFNEMVESVAFNTESVAD